MRLRYLFCPAFFVFLSLSLLHAQAPAPETPPSDAKAQKTFQDALTAEKNRRYLPALELFKQANKQDDKRCWACAEHIVHLGENIGDTKAALGACDQLSALAHTPEQQTAAHFLRGFVFLREGMRSRKEARFIDSDAELKQALALSPRDPESLYADGLALAYLSQDAQAKARFTQFIAVSAPNSVDHRRALRYVERPELARARMAPAFAVTTLTGERLSLDDLTGKVVLIDFWATWCGPCRQALPRVRELAQKFSGQPFVVLSVSLDSDEAKWKDFVAKNGMTWPQYRAGSFTAPLSSLFNIQAIPSTFTIDSDGVLQDEHVGDSNLEGKIRKLLAQAQRHANAETTRVGGE